MKILAFEKDVAGVTDEQFTVELLREEAQKAWEYYENGIFREIYFTKNDNRAVIVLECETGRIARSYLQQLPLVINKLIDFEIYELRSYDGFKRLF